MKKWFCKAAAGIAGVLFVASAMTLVAPKTVHAVVSALVTVANTSANPVVNRDVDNPARLGFQGSAQIFGSSGASINVPSTTPTGAPVKELVIEEVSGLCQGSTNQIFLSLTTNGATSGFLFQTVPGVGVFSSVIPTQSVRLYEDATTPIVLQEVASATCSVSISGYLVTQ